MIIRTMTQGSNRHILLFYTIFQNYKAMEDQAPGRWRATDRERRRTGMDRFAQTLLDAGRGIVIFGVGIFFGIAGKLGISLAIDDP